mgnify:CR=1 FL=1
MKKFWRNGMVDKRVIGRRKQEEYINKLNRTILELSRKPPEPEPIYRHPDIGDLINDIKPFSSIQLADDYDEVRVGDNVILEFNNGIIVIAAPRDAVSEALLKFNKQFITKTPVKDSIKDSYAYWLRKNADKRCDADIKYGRKIEEIIKNENNTRTLRQEE